MQLTSVNPSLAVQSFNLPTLKQGDSGDAVVLLQQQLNFYADPITVDGQFGPHTAFAVRSYQYSRFLEEDGIVGPQTWALLQDPMTPHLPTLAFLSQGEEVRWVQKVLLTLGYYRRGDEPAEIDGQFLELTQQAVVRYQTDTDAAADGVVGPMTWSMLGFDRLDTQSRVSYRNIELFSRQKRHANRISAIATNSNTGIVLTGSRDTTVRAWSARGQALGSFAGDRGSVSDVAFMPDGQQLVSSTLGGTVSLTQRRGFVPVERFPGRGSSVLAVDVSANGELIATGNGDRNARIFNTAGELLLTLPDIVGNVSGVAFSPRGNQFVTATQNFQVLLWQGINGLDDLNPRRPMILAQAMNNSQHSAIARFSPSGLKIAIATGSILSIYNDQGFRLHLIDEGIVINDIAFSPSGSHLALACSDAKVRILAMRELNNAQGHRIRELNGHQTSVESLAFASTGTFLYSGDSQGELLTWKLT